MSGDPAVEGQPETGASTSIATVVGLDRASELDVLAGVLPFDARERLATLLTDNDVAKLKHLAREGLGANTFRALASDLDYLEAWCRAATGSPLPWPATSR